MNMTLAEHSPEPHGQDRWIVLDASVPDTELLVEVRFVYKAKQLPVDARQRIVHQLHLQLRKEL